MKYYLHKYAANIRAVRSNRTRLRFGVFAANSFLHMEISLICVIRSKNLKTKFCYALGDQQASASWNAWDAVDTNFFTSQQEIAQTHPFRTNSISYTADSGNRGGIKHKHQDYRSVMANLKKLR